MELKANELRYGNKLLFLGDVVTFKNITEIREDGIFWIKTFEPKIESKNFHFKPIPLTEDWLLKFGFIQCYGKFGEYFKCSNLDGFRIWFNENEHTSWWSIGRKDYDNNDTTLIFENCKTLHQLQNLYFALTNEELEIKM